MEGLYLVSDSTGAMVQDSAEAQGAALNKIAKRDREHDKRQSYDVVAKHRVQKK